MSSYNRGTWVGRVATDVDVRPVSDTKQVATFRIAVGRGMKDKQTDQWLTDFFNVELWDKQAEQAAMRLSKGSLVLIDGSLRNDTWVDKETKQNREKTKIVGTFKALDKQQNSEDE